jgi:hypothetical protein
MPVAQWAAGRKAIMFGDGTAVARWTAQCRQSGASDKVTFLYFQTCVFFCQSKPLAPDFRYSFGFSTRTAQVKKVEEQVEQLSMRILQVPLL